MSSELKNKFKTALIQMSNQVKGRDWESKRKEDAEKSKRLEHTIEDSWASDLYVEIVKLCVDKKNIQESLGVEISKDWIGKTPWSEMHRRIWGLYGGAKETGGSPLERFLGMDQKEADAECLVIRGEVVEIFKIKSEQSGKEDWSVFFNFPQRQGFGRKESIKGPCFVGFLNIAPEKATKKNIWIEKGQLSLCYFDPTKGSNLSMQKLRKNPIGWWIEKKADEESLKITKELDNISNNGEIEPIAKPKKKL